MTKKLLLQAGILLLSGCVSVALAQAGGGSAGGGAAAGGGHGSGAATSSQSGAQASGGGAASSTSGHRAGMPQSDTGNAGHARTIKGCIMQEGGNYYIVENKGKGRRIQLQAGNTDLSAHVGHEVKVHGTMESGNAASMGATGSAPGGNTSASPSTGTTTGAGANASSSSNTGNTRTMMVDKVDMVSENCSNSGSSTKSPY